MLLKSWSYYESKNERDIEWLNLLLHCKWLLLSLLLFGPQFVISGTKLSWNHINRDQQLTNNEDCAVTQRLKKKNVGARAHCRRERSQRWKQACRVGWLTTLQKQAKHCKASVFCSVCNASHCSMDKGAEKLETKHWRSAEKLEMKQRWEYHRICCGWAQSDDTQPPKEFRSTCEALPSGHTNA